MPVAGILRLPGLILTPAEFEKAARIVLPYVEAQYAKLDLVVIGTYYYPPLVVYSARRKIASLADLKGLKIRMLSPESSEWARRLGAAPVTMSFPELAPALDRSAIDAVSTTASGAGYSLRDLIKYEYRVPIAYSQVYEIINRSALEALPAAAQDVVKKVFSERLTALSRSIADDDVTLERKMQDGGLQVVTPTPEDAAASEKVMVSYWGAWANERGPAIVEALAKVRSELGR